MQQIHFNPKARLVKILGEQLIKDSTVGLIELIKNSYDADAINVEIKMYSLNTLQAMITIGDDGDGMDLVTFLDKWMNPFHGHKEKQKQDNIRTELGRLPLGEKGVGRFAAQQIGGHLVMISKKEDSDEELYVEINWNDFEKEDKNLDEVKIAYEMRKHEHFNSNAKGTYLVISNFESKPNFKESDIKKISSTLRRMISPFKGANDFNIKLSFINCNEAFNKYSDLSSSNILEKAPYTFYGIVHNDGKVEYEFNFNMPGYKDEKINANSDIKQDTSIDFLKSIKVGSFFVNFHFYSKAPNELRIMDIEKNEIVDWAGVNVYRDGIRVLPYGEKGNDWLHLDNRKIQKSDSLGNDVVIGFVEINQTENQELKDKTNREGLIENEYYEKFRSLVIGAYILAENEVKRYKKIQKSKRTKTPTEKIEKKVASIQADLKSGNFESAERNLSDLTVEINDSINILEKEKDILSNLAGTGLTVERMTHEFSRLVNSALFSLNKLKQYIDLTNENVVGETNSIDIALNALRNEIRLLGPMLYVNKASKEKELNIKDVINNTIKLQEHSFKKNSVKYNIIGDNFKIVMREGACMQVFDNLIDNAIYWCSRNEKLEDRNVRIVIDSVNNSVFISDSGSGVPERFKENIFDPFFSMKEDGRGLGLFIAKEIMDEKKFPIELAELGDNSNLLQGASFKLTFNSDN
jgi:signal transduction histidine kinase